MRAMSRRIRYVDDDRIRLYGMLRETHGRIERVCARTVAEQLGIAGNVHEVLLRLAHAPQERLRVTDLAACLELTTGGATRLVNRVVAQGLAEKHSDPDDRRVQWVELTALGRKTVERAARLRLAELDRELFSRLSERELRTLVTVLDRLNPDLPE